MHLMVMCWNRTPAAEELEQRKKGCLRKLLSIVPEDLWQVEDRPVPKLNEKDGGDGTALPGVSDKETTSPARTCDRVHRGIFTRLWRVLEALQAGLRLGRSLFPNRQ